MKKLNAVFLRGLSRDSRHWLDLPEIFESKGLFKDLMFLDLPGFGKQWQQVSPINVKDITNRIREQWLEKRIDGEYILISISLGGMIGIDWGARFANDLEGLVVINSSLPQVSSRFERLTPEGYIELAKMFSAPDYELREEFILKLTSNQPKNVEKYLKTFTRYQLEMTADKKDIIRQAIAAKRMDVHDELNAPLLCLTSKADRMVNHQCSIDIAKKYNGNIDIHETAGHDLTMDDPLWVADKVEAWIKSLGSIME